MYNDYNEYGYMSSYLTIWDLYITPFFLIIIYFIGKVIKERNIRTKPYYKYYQRALFFKIFGSIVFCLIYTLYYGGGDTTNYYESGVAIANLLDVDYHKFFDILYNGEIDKRIHYFTNETGFPVYKRDVHSAFVSRIIAVFTLVGFKAYIPTTILLSFVCFIGNWKLYVLFIEYFPKIQKELFIALLAIPSILFWGAGISKDTITLSALGWYVYGFNKFFILKKDRIISGIYLGIASYLLIVIKPYIFFATLPGSVIWFFSDFTHRIGSKLIKFLIGPIFLSVAVLFSYYILLNFGENLGQYSLDNVFNKASTTQKDFKNNEAYSKNSFDIGDFEPTLAGSLKKAHLAIAAGLFRPYLWDARNAVMLLSALENTYIALLTFFLLLRLKFFGFFFLINKHPLLLFSFLFALFFAFAVGLSTANFGALVRLKIPCIPFFVASLFILKHLYQVKSGRKLGI